MTTVPEADFHVTGLHIRMPADGTSRTVTFSFTDGTDPVNVDSSWTVVALTPRAGADLATVVGTGDGTDSFDATFTAAMVNQSWALRHGGQERAAGKLVARSLAPGAPSDETVSVTVDDAGSSVAVTITDVGGVSPDDLATVATTGSYDDLDDKPSIPSTPGDVGAATSAQGALADTAVQPADLATVATSNSYTDLDDKPSIPSTAADVGAVATTGGTVTGDVIFDDGITESRMSANASGFRAGNGTHTLTEVSSVGMDMGSGSGPPDVRIERAGTGAFLISNPLSGDPGLLTGLAAPSDDTDAARKSYVDDETAAVQSAVSATLAYPGKVGSMSLHPTGMAAWEASIDAARARKGHVVVIGDSLSVQYRDSTHAWPWQLRRLFQASTGHAYSPSDSITSPPPLKFGGQSTAVFQPVTDSSTGTDTATALAGYGTRLDPTETCTYTWTGTAVTVVHRLAPGDGTLSMVIDGGAPTVVSCTGTAGTALWESAVISGGNHTLTITASSAACTVEAIMGHDAADAADGMRVWPACRAGATAASFVANPAYSLDLIEHLNNDHTLDLVVVAVGTNDNPDYPATALDPLLAAIQSRTNAPVVLWVPPVNGFFSATERADGLAWAASNGLMAIDSTSSTGPISTHDVLHPSRTGHLTLANIAWTALSGDPVGVSASQLAALRSAINTGTVNARSTVNAGTTAVNASSVNIGGDATIYRQGAAHINIGSPFAALLDVPDGLLRLGRLGLHTSASMPASGRVGDLINHAGTFKYCTVTGTPGTWATVQDSTVSTWTNATLINSWTQATGTARHRLIGSHTVEIDLGYVTGGASGSSAFVLPADRRPSAEQTYPVMCTADGTVAGMATIAVQTDGNVNLTFADAAKPVVAGRILVVL